MCGLFKGLIERCDIHISSVLPSFVNSEMKKCEKKILKSKYPNYHKLGLHKEESNPSKITQYY